MIKYLKKIMNVSTIILYIVGMYSLYKKISNKHNKELLQIKGMSDKHLRLFKLMNAWTNAKVRGAKVVDYLEEKNIKSVAIYGLNYVGQTLINELEKENIDIRYGIDQNPEFFCQNFEVISPDDKFREVDVIIVTPICSFEDIKNKIQNKVSGQIISIEEIIDYI